MGLFDRLFGQKNEQSQEAAETVASNDLTDDISETESLDIKTCKTLTQKSSPLIIKIYQQASQLVRVKLSR